MRKFKLQNNLKCEVIHTASAANFLLQLRRLKFWKYHMVRWRCVQTEFCQSPVIMSRLRMVVGFRCFNSSTDESWEMRDEGSTQRACTDNSLGCWSGVHSLLFPYTMVDSLQERCVLVLCRAECRPSLLLTADNLHCSQYCIVNTWYTDIMSSNCLQYLSSVRSTTM